MRSNMIARAAESRLPMRISLFYATTMTNPASFLVGWLIMWPGASRMPTLA
jgi:hypothetical protein